MISRTCSFCHHADALTLAHAELIPGFWSEADELNLEDPSLYLEVCIYVACAACHLPRGRVEDCWRFPLAAFVPHFARCTELDYFFASIEPPRVTAEANLFRGNEPVLRLTIESSIRLGGEVYSVLLKKDLDFDEIEPLKDE